MQWSVLYTPFYYSCQHINKLQADSCLHDSNIKPFFLASYKEVIIIIMMVSSSSMMMVGYSSLLFLCGTSSVVLWPCPGPCLAKSDLLSTFPDSLWNCTTECTCSYGDVQLADGECQQCVIPTASNVVPLPTLITDCNDEVASFTCAQGYFNSQPGGLVCVPCQEPPPGQTCALGMYQKRCLETANLECYPCTYPTLNQTSQQYGPQNTNPPCSPGFVFFCFLLLFPSSVSFFFSSSFVFFFSFLLLFFFFFSSFVFFFFFLLLFFFFFLFFSFFLFSFFLFSYSFSSFTSFHSFLKADYDGSAYDGSICAPYLTPAWDQYQCLVYCNEGYVPTSSSPNSIPNCKPCAEVCTLGYHH